MGGEKMELPEFFRQFCFKKGDVVCVVGGLTFFSLFLRYFLFLFTNSFRGRKTIKVLSISDYPSLDYIFFFFIFLAMHFLAQCLLLTCNLRVIMTTSTKIGNDKCLGTTILCTDLDTLSKSISALHFTPNSPFLVTVGFEFGSDKLIGIPPERAIPLQSLHVVLLFAPFVIPFPSSCSGCCNVILIEPHGAL
jgi:hypothetical protein